MRTLLLLCLALPAAAQPLAPADHAMLAEAVRLVAALDGTLWERAAVPFAVLLVDGDREVLVGHPTPPDGWAPAGEDPALGGAFHVRPRQVGPGLLATFPIGGVPTVVVGTAGQTGREPTAWVLTLLHERVHQRQMSRPGYFGDVAALDLAGGDTSGMWMLDFPFPYADPAVGAAFAGYRWALACALGARDPEAALTHVVQARASLRAVLAPRDDRYFDFQLWQEGVARYGEIRLAHAAASVEPPGPAFQALGAVPYADAAHALRASLASELAAVDLARDGRLAFYAVGAAHALVLDAARPGWHRRALAPPFALPPP
ncbi:hypothetical protein [Rubrivirga sp. IMCC45206]|uniref:hypothetical protein n=1 Tax=Rubrivirga sp. IMCC45206 TaxID=3391614 RepID=UPI00398FB82D